MITASDGQVAVSIPVKVNIVQPVLFYLGIAGASVAVVAAAVVYLRHRHKRAVGLSSTGRPIEPTFLHQQNPFGKLLLW